MYDAVLCDLDGVLRIWPDGARDEIERRHGLAPGALFDAAFAPELVHAAVMGAIADELWRERVAEMLDALAKPDPACYRAAAALVRAESARCIVIDDTPKHLEGARAAGMTTIQHVDVATTRASLIRIGMISAAG